MSIPQARRTRSASAAFAPLSLVSLAIAIAGCQSRDAGGSGGHAASSRASEAAAPVGASGALAAPAITVTWTPDAPADAGSEPYEEHGDHPSPFPFAFRNKLAITNRGAEPLALGWKLYFSMGSPPRVEGARTGAHGDAGGAGADAGDTGGEASPQGLRCAHGDAARSGDYFVIEPLPQFVPIRPGETRIVTMLTSGGSLQKSDAPAGFHLLLPGESQPRAVHASVVVDASDTRLAQRVAGDVLPVETARVRYGENAPVTQETLDVAGTLLPSPLSVRESGGSYVLPADASIAFQPGLESEAAYLQAALGDVLAGAFPTTASSRSAASGASASIAAAITLSLDDKLHVAGPAGEREPEAYTLVIDDKGIAVTGADAAGVLHGVETLRQLVPADVYRAAVRPEERRRSARLPAVTIADAPLFAYRGMQLDVARHFQSKDAVKKLLDLLAAHKINKLHFHLSDDEGWRLEIPGLPELTDYGARRGFDPAEARMLHPALGSTEGLGAGDGIAGKAADETAANGGTPPGRQGFDEATLNFVGQGSGFYTRADFVEILRYAAERHIDVVPEFDMPAHARAAVRSMEHRFHALQATDAVSAGQYRLIDPDDTTRHTSVQGYVDNLMNPCLESTYAFFGKVFAEVQAMYASAGLKLALLHVGGDEPPGTRWWRDSPACAANPETKDRDDAARKDYFFTRLHRAITAAGVTMTGWDDVLIGGRVALPGFVSMPWSNTWGDGGEDAAYRRANAGRPVVLAHATNLYMDLAYGKDPDEPGYDWANYVDEQRTFEYLPFDVFAIATRDRMGRGFPPARWARMARLTPAGRSHVLGIEGLLWSENVKTQALLEYMTFPKILGVAERAWNRRTPAAAALPEAWQRFVNTLGQAELPRLDAFRPVDVRRELAQPRPPGVNYRIPVPGAVVEGGALHANVRYPSFAIEYSADGGKTWQPYAAPVPAPATAGLLVRAKTSDGRPGRAARVE